MGGVATGMKLQRLYDRHLVTAAQAAYTSLNKWFLWTGEVQIKNHDVPATFVDEWRYVVSATCTICHSTGRIKEGVNITFEEPFQGDWWHEQLYRAIQAGGSPARWVPDYPFPVQCGIGVRIMLPGAAENDVIHTVVKYARL